MPIIPQPGEDGAPLCHVCGRETHTLDELFDCISKSDPPETPRMIGEASVRLLDGERLRG